MSTGWIAVWIPDGEISQKEMMEYGREAVEHAKAHGAETVTIVISPERQVTMTRVVLTLPIFIESPDWREAREFADALSERADRSFSN